MGFGGKEMTTGEAGGRVVVAAEEIIYRKYDGGEVKHLKTGMDMAPKVPFGEAHEIPLDRDRRDPFVDWLHSKEQPLFGKSMAQRVWRYFLGRGILWPSDGNSARN